MTPADFDQRVLLNLKAGLTSARAISEAEGVNSTAVKHSLMRLESRNLAVHLGTTWKALTERGEA